MARVDVTEGGAAGAYYDVPDEVLAERKSQLADIYKQSGVQPDKGQEQQFLGGQIDPAQFGELIARRADPHPERTLDSQGGAYDTVTGQLTAQGQSQRAQQLAGTGAWAKSGPVGVGVNPSMAGPGGYAVGAYPGDLSGLIAKLFGGTIPSGSGAYQDLAYWEKQGVQGSQIYDPATGQLRPGWRRTAKGYERDAAPGAAVTGQAGTGTGTSRTTATTVPAQFTDPITSAIEGFAQTRAQQLESPPSGSGQAQLEQMLNEFAQQWRSGGYTPHELEVLQTQGTDPLESARTARKQQVIQQLSARGIAPTSGVALQMLADVDRQFDAQRSQLQGQLASQAAQQVVARQLQALQALSGLASTENQRLDAAYGYRTVPMQLADRAFTQASGLLGQQGNPASLINPLLQLQSQQYGQSQASQQALGYFLQQLLAAAT